MPNSRPSLARGLTALPKPGGNQTPAWCAGARAPPGATAVYRGMKHGTIWIGTSGWVYKQWAGNFYPDGWPKKDELGYYRFKIRSQCPKN